MVWLRGGNNRLFYLGMMPHISVIWLLEIQAHWVLKFILKDISMPRLEQVEADNQGIADMWVTNLYDGLEGLLIQIPIFYEH